MNGIKVRLAMAGLLASVALGTIGAPVAQAGRTACWVRNVTQGTVGRSFAGMVAAAVDGDRLTVLGPCLARNVVVWSDLTIQGMDVRRAVLDARGEHRVLRIRSSATVTLRHLVITGGKPTTSWSGSGIHTHGTLILSDSVVRGNVSEVDGGGVYNLGTMTLIGSVVRDNTADHGGGLLSYGTMSLSGSLVRDNTGSGITNGDTLTLIDSVVRDNTARRGAGIWNTNYASATLTDSVVRGNTAVRTGGGIKNDANNTLILNRTTKVKGNSAGTVGGGIWTDDSSTVTLLEGSSVTGNTPDDCYGTTAC